MERSAGRCSQNSSAHDQIGLVRGTSFEDQAEVHNVPRPAIRIDKVEKFLGCNDIGGNRIAHNGVNKPPRGTWQRRAGPCLLLE